jgi:putative NADH-flavin reductase
MSSTIIGGTGKAGQYLVNELLRQEIPFKMIPRPAGDMSDIQAVRALLKDCTVVISTIGQRPGEPLISTLATRHVLQVMEEYGIRRYILVAGLTIDVPGDQKSVQNREMTGFMQRTYPDATADKQRTFELLSNSRVNWTLVRVPVIRLAEATRSVAVQLDDCPGTEINAGDLARFLVAQVDDGTYIQQAPFIANR